MFRAIGLIGVGCASAAAYDIYSRPSLDSLLAATIDGKKCVISGKKYNSLFRKDRFVNSNFVTGTYYDKQLCKFDIFNFWNMQRIRIPDNAKITLEFDENIAYGTPLKVTVDRVLIL